MIEFDARKIKKILIVQYKPFGDVLLNTAYLPFLRKKFPQAKIHYLLYSPYDQVLQDNPYIDKLIVFPRKKGLAYVVQRVEMLIKIRKQRYDLVIDQLRGSGSAQLVLLSGAPYRVGYGGEFWDFAYNIKGEKGPLRYYAAMKFDLLKPLGIVEESFRTFYKIRQDSFDYIDSFLAQNKLSEKSFICVAPGSPVAKKKWKSAHYAELCDRILENSKYGIIFMFAPGEEDDVQIVMQKMKNKAHLSPPTNFNQAAALLERSRLLICNDGGLNHLAIAVNTPSLAFFGNTNPLKWSGHELGNHFYLRKEAALRSRDNSFGITVDEAFEKVKEILAL